MASDRGLQDFLLQLSSRIEKMEVIAINAGFDTRVSSSEIAIIDKIGEDGSAKMGHVARALGITLATLTVACDRLEAKGMIVRRRNEKDKRTVTVSLTEKGLVLFSFHREFQDNLLSVILDELSDEDRRVLMHCVRKINDILSTGDEMEA